jgi:hypothetical protein
MDIGFKVEWYRSPFKRDLVKYVFALLSLCGFLASLLGYHWAWEQFENGSFY